MNDTTSEGTPLEDTSGAVINNTDPSKWRHRRTLVVPSALLVLVLVIAVVLALTRERSGSQTAEAYTLVPDKISQSAAITVLLPENISTTNFDPKRSILFSPEIKGAWDIASSKNPRQYRYLPEQKLAVGTYYLASLDTPQMKLQKMFSIDQDPSVLAVFPKQEAEVSEYTNITIMFSRPMVALSTLSENADILPQVTITPATEGRWKWITTRTLQFIPAKRLLRASNYRVEIGAGMYSTDGVSVPPFAHTFTTRSLNYASYGADANGAVNLTHMEPLRVYFNQPINLDGTRAKVSLVSGANLPVPFVAAYGTRVVTDEKTGKAKTLTDQSILEIYPDKDSHGRAYLWDFDGTYHFSLSGAVPIEGDVPFALPLARDIHIEAIITDITAQSPRSNQVTPEIFDPQGTLTFHTSEPIDLAASNISGKGVLRAAYGEKCREPAPGEEVTTDETSCAKVPDQTNIVLYFDPQQFALGETSSITFTKLVNTDGITLATAPLTTQFTTYKKFAILRSTPGDNSTNGDLKALVLCSTNPIGEPAEDDFYKQVRSNMMIGKWDWGASFLVAPGDTYSSQTCPVGTFLTTIKYGLVPKFAYELTLALDDHFGQHVEKMIRFTTADADPLAKGFVHMQPSVLMTPPDRTTLTYGLDFMNDITVTVCKVTPETMLRYRVFPPDITDNASTLSCTDSITKYLTLPASPATRKYFQVDLRDYFPDTLGNYVVVLSNPGYRRVSTQWRSDGKQTFTLGEKLYEKTFVTVTRLAVGSKQVERTDHNAGYGDTTNTAADTAFMKDKWPSNLYWVNDFRTLSPSAGAVVTPYATKDTALIKLPSKTTDGEGIAETPSADNIAGAIVTQGNDSAIIANATDALSYVQSAGADRREYIYTDRPIYRPGDTVHIKGIARIGFDAAYEAASGSTTVEIRDAKYETARKEEVHFNKNGTYEMTFVLDSSASLGYYQISTDNGYGSFQVEEYVAPQFKVGITADKDEYISGETAKLSIAADYYFGVPVDQGTAQYRIVSQDYYFDRYQDSYFNFGRGWYENENGWYGDHFISSGKLQLGHDGTVSLAQAFDIDKLFTGDYRKQSKIITVYVTVTNENGQSVSSQHSFILHRGTFYAGITTNDYFYVSGTSGTVKIKTVDTKGKPVQKSNLTLSLERIDWKSYKRQEVDGNFYYRTEQVKTKVSSVTLDTDKNGDGSAPFTAGAEGQYEYTVEGTDELGNVVSAQYDFYVSGEGSIYVRPTNNASLDLHAEKTDLEVGGVGSFVITSPYPHAKALVTIARGDIYERKILDLSSQLTQYQFTVTPDELPGVTAQVLLLSPDPEIKYGELSFSVNTKAKKLAIAITPNKKLYLPGEAVTLDVNVKDASGQPAPAELSLSVVDMSVLALVGNPKKDPVSFFYGYAPLSIRTAANVKNILNVAEIPVGTKGGSGGGGDDLEKKQRGVFRDTAYWEGTVTTDAAGHATVRFTLPDNLTQWQVESVGVTKDTKVGAGYSDFTTKKTIMAVPLKPRFIIPGDAFAVGGTIFNESDSPQKLSVSVTSPSLTFTGETNASLTVDPHSSLSVSFPARAPESVVLGTHAFTLSAKNDTYEDTVTNSFPIEQNNTYEFTATGGRVSDANWQEEVYLPSDVIADRGGLTLNVSATMASMLDSAIEGMLIYPYECSEQVASKLRTIAIVKQNAALFGTGTATPMLPERITMGDQSYTIDEVVNIGLAKLYANEGGDGGVTFYPNTPPSFWVTLSTLQTYIDLRNAGYAVDANKMTLAAQYISNWINYPRSNYVPSSEDVIESAYVLSAMKDSRLITDVMRAKLLSYANNKDMVARGLSTPALAYLAILSAQEKFGTLATNRLFAEFENRSHIDARGTVVGASAESPSLYAEGSITDTALALKAFAEAKRDSPLLEGYVRAIKNSKSHDGGWSSTYNSITVIDAVTQYMKWKNEANAHMNVAVTLDNATLFTAAFDKTNILDTYATSVPMSMLKKGVNEQITFTKKNLGLHDDAYYYDMLLKYYLPANAIAPRDEGFSVERAFYRLDDTTFANPVTSATQGEVLHGRVIISTPTRRSHVAIEDFIPAGVEIINQNFATEDHTLGNTDTQDQGGVGMRTTASPGGSWITRELASIFSFGASATGPQANTDGIVSDEMYANKSTALESLYPSAIENHDDRIFAYVEDLEPGQYVFDYYVRALVPGVYQHLPLVVSELYTPENFGRTKGETFTVTKKDN